MGAELNGRSDGPGGAIILREGERWGRTPGASGAGGIQSLNDVAASLAALGGRRTTARSGSTEEDGTRGEGESRRGGSRRRAEMERFLQNQGADVEEVS